MTITEDFELPAGSLVADTIYQPSETPFLKSARSEGLTALNGLRMLLLQAVEVFEIWTGETMSVAEIWSALEEKCNAK